MRGRKRQAPPGPARLRDHFSPDTLFGVPPNAADGRAPHGKGARPVTQVSSKFIRDIPSHLIRQTEVSPATGQCLSARSFSFCSLASSFTTGQFGFAAGHRHLSVHALRRHIMPVILRGNKGSPCVHLPPWLVMSKLNANPCSKKAPAARKQETPSPSCLPSSRPCDRFLVESRQHGHGALLAAGLTPLRAFGAKVSVPSSTVKPCSLQVSLTGSC